MSQYLLSTEALRQRCDLRRPRCLHSRERYQDYGASKVLYVRECVSPEPYSTLQNDKALLGTLVSFLRHCRNVTCKQRFIGTEISIVDKRCWLPMTHDPYISPVALTRKYAWCRGCPPFSSGSSTSPNALCISRNQSVLFTCDGKRQVDAALSVNRKEGRQAAHTVCESHNSPPG